MGTMGLRWAFLVGGQLVCASAVAQTPTATLPPTAPAPSAAPPAGAAPAPAPTPSAPDPGSASAPAPAPPAPGSEQPAPPPPLPVGPPPPLQETGVMPPAPSPQPPATEPSREPSAIAVPAPDPTIRRHDGFYGRLGLGIGHARMKLELPKDFGLSDRSLVASDTGAAIEIALGGTVAEGLVVGGGLYTQAMGEVSWDGDSVRAFDVNGDRDIQSGQGSVSLLAILVDWYPDARGGFHVQGALGLSGISLESSSRIELPPEKWEGGGAGLMLGVGYEFWVANQWSLGGVARALFLGGKLQNPDRDYDVDIQVFSPALLFVATHH